MLELLETLSRYSFFDIFFGVGITSLFWRFLRRFVPINCPHLHVDIKPGPQVKIRGIAIPDSLRIDIRNSGATNIYIARAYFRAKIRPWWLLWVYPLHTRLQVHPESDRIADLDAYELKFEGDIRNGFTEYEALVRPRHENGVSTWLALSESPPENLVKKRKCGALYVEYATAGGQGIHKVRL